MNKKLFASLPAVFAGALLCAQEPVLDYDYTSGAFERRGKTPPPVVAGETLMAEELPGAIRFDGKKNFMTIPGGKSFSLRNGGTLFAFVRFAEDEEHGMLFFKLNEFLLGLYSKDRLYFNIRARGGEKFDAPVMTASVPRGKWCTVAAVLRPWKNGSWTAFLFIDGVRKTSNTFRFADGYPETKADLTVGRGWGGTWFLKGDIGALRLYDTPLDEKQILELSDKYLKRK
ncbi:MAG: LamG domain-containing protein [Lentisphaeria bacterium]|nr:LamG domain-containing protein [Lentisphaeria bacterium]